jgi:predicted dienelactone hydrolase
MINDPSSYLTGPQDIVFLLNSLPGLEDAIPALKDRLDPTRVGVGGHSLGAFNALAIAGATVYPVNQAKRLLGDTRPLAYLALSPPGAKPKEGPFHKDSWTAISRPVFLVTGTADRWLGNEPPLWRTEAFAGLKAGHKYLAVLNGATHTDFVGALPDGTVRAPRLHRWLQQATLLFWDAYLKRDREAQQALKTSGWPSVQGVKLRTESK